MEKRIRTHEKKVNLDSGLEGNTTSKINSPGNSDYSNALVHGSLGNQAVKDLFESGQIQAFLKLSSPGDIFESEADRVADKVLNMQVAGGAHASQTVDDVLKKPKPAPVENNRDQLSSSVESKIKNLAGGSPLSAGDKEFFESRFDQDFSNVRIHAGSNAGKLAESINARAFTFGNNIVFGNGQYSPGTNSGKRLMAHELTHVVQQTGGKNKDSIAQTHGPAVQLERKPRWSRERKEARKRRMQEEHDLLWFQRAKLGEIHQYDEEFFETYLSSQKQLVTVYRGDGRGINEDSLDNYELVDINPKPGDPDISFYGVVAHTHSNTSPGGMVSTTSIKAQAIEWASDSHNWSLVYEIRISDYIDVNYLLNMRNFRNRYEGQHEFLIPRAIQAREIKSVSLYKKGEQFVKKLTFN